MPEATSQQTAGRSGTQMPFVGVTCLGKFQWPSSAEACRQCDTHTWQPLETAPITGISTLQFLGWKILGGSGGEELSSVRRAFRCLLQKWIHLIWYVRLPRAGSSMDSWINSCLSVLIPFWMSCTCNLSLLLLTPHAYSTSFPLWITPPGTSWVQFLLENPFQVLWLTVSSDRSLYKTQCLLDRHRQKLLCRPGSWVGEDGDRMGIASEGVYVCWVSMKEWDITAAFWGFSCTHPFL